MCMTVEKSNRVPLRPVSEVQLFQFGFYQRVSLQDTTNTDLWIFSHTLHVIKSRLELLNRISHNMFLLSEAHEPDECV